MFSTGYISHCETCPHGCLFTNRYVIKPIMCEAEIKQIFRFFKELGEIVAKKIRKINTIFVLELARLHPTFKHVIKLRLF